jgi:O-antigen ligase
LFGLFSVLWSDFQFIAFKRWFRDLGNYLVILVVLSDPRPLEAVRTVLRRLCYLLIPLSILLIKYFPEMAKHYEIWSGVAEYVGAATSKNMLGAMCLVSALFFFWDTTTRWSERKEWRTKKIFVVNLALIAMTLWLLNLASSATSRVCLAIGCVVILAVQSKWGKRHPTFLKISIPATFCLYVILAFGFGLNGEFASKVGRDPTLTDRTIIWKAVLGQHTNPLVGVGYESFWLGPRLQSVWEMSGLKGITEAHNGYLEFYLDFGFIGLLFLGGLLTTGYRTICRQLASSPSLASLNLGFWTIMLFYNITEAAFKSHLMWVTFVMAVIAVPKRAEDRMHAFSAAENEVTAKPLPKPQLEVARQRR